VCYKNMLATYSHVHATGTPAWAEGLIRRALAHQREVKNDSEKKKKDLDNRKTNTGVGDGVR
jgi:hypothetical protein